MKMNVYAIRDSKMECFNRPFVMPADGAAVRAFQDEINNPQGEMSKHPSDYTLYTVGKFDEDTGELDGSTPLILAKGIDLKYREEN